MHERLDPETKSGAQVRQMFRGIAPRYDLLNRVLSVGQDRRWRRLTVARALEGLGGGLRVLDLCCGTGDLALAFERDERVEQVVGVDFAPEMLRRAGRKSGRRIGLLAADAERLPLVGASFDVISIAFGLRNLVEPRSGLQAMAQLLRPGGRLAVLEFYRPPPGLAATLFRVYFRRILPHVGRLVSGGEGIDAYRYLPESVEQFPDVGAVRSWMEECGLRTVHCQPFTFGAVALLIAERTTSSPAPDRRPGTGEVLAASRRSVLCSTPFATTGSTRIEQTGESLPCSQ